jgi:elongation factor G
MMNFTPKTETIGEIGFKSTVIGGNISHDLIPAVEVGIRYEASVGINRYPPLTDFDVVLQDGQMHPVDSKKKAFELVGRYGLRDAAEDNMKILEPYVTLTVYLVGDYLGRVVGEITNRRGRLDSVESGDSQVIKAQVPLANMFGFVDVLRSITSGTGTAFYEPDRYEEVPEYLVDSIIIN